ncbi:hypothetical protein PC128_g8031 [Phytophthora cactorum]|nr:hypothetical protein PC128_g8031 [Phytophthora cactorum]
MDATDEAVLGARKSQSTSVDSVSVAAGMFNDPITLSEGSTRSPEPDRDDDAGLASGADSSSEDRRSSRRKRLHSQVFGSDDEDDDEPFPPSSQDLGLAVRGVPPPSGKPPVHWATRRSFYDSDDGAESSAPAKKSKRRIRGASANPKSHRKSKKHNKIEEAQEALLQDSSSCSDRDTSSRSVPAPAPVVNLPSPSSASPSSASSKSLAWCSVPLNSSSTTVPPRHGHPQPLCAALQLSLSVLRTQAQSAADTLSLVGIRAFVSIFHSNHPFQRLRRMPPELPFFFSPAIFEEARRWLASQTRPSSLLEIHSGMWAKMRGECSPSFAAAATSVASGKTTTRDDLSTRFFVALYDRRIWLVESSVLMDLPQDLSPSATPEELAEMFELWSRYKLTRKHRGDALRSLVVSAYNNLYSAVTQQISGQPAPIALDVNMEEPRRAWWLTDPASHPRNTCFRARNVDFMVFAHRGMVPRAVEDVI